ncbi:MAG: undecaprenyldiphospho-muramoylpentapeptide beta-N-acetylglucosaminyltransferase [Defluviitaleaceae bacterium]|nr:undecaprenyldiphospho-muramoylpentapeptide beta-N-acetylglucosaminyltransferase [Defluviitaleaceae bacterium]
MKKIILTGGGTAGHVTPNLALLPGLREAGYEIFYVGSKTGIEKDIIAKAGLTYYGISAGKLRRYLDLRNISDIFRVLKGYGEAAKLIRELKPDVVFSKGGFVAAPVVAAAKMAKVKTVIHESDMTPGLANRLSIPFADMVCVNFPETVSHIRGGRAVLTGSPIRPELFCGSKKEGAALCAFHDTKPVILAVGGSLGSVTVNKALRASLGLLRKDFNVAHVCGKGNAAPEAEGPGYRQFEYVNEELPHLFAYADAVVSRAGANFIFEILALQKPNLLIPLSIKASRGDQILNAESFRRQGFSEVLEEEELSPEKLAAAVRSLYKNREKYREAMAVCPMKNGADEVLKVIQGV